MSIDYIVKDNPLQPNSFYLRTVPKESIRKEHIIQRVLTLSEEACQNVLQEILESFGERHVHFEDTLLKNYQQIV